MNIRNRERILEAIDQLRRRKARPDIQRICNYLFRRFSINFAEAKSDLQSCVENNVVLKVEYKGSISYRNAAKKYSHLKRADMAENNNSTNKTITDKANRKFAQLLTNAFGELVVNEPDYLEFGIPADEIINNILSKDSVRYTKNYISILIEKEVDNGGLIKMDNNNYLMGPKEGRKSSDDVKIVAENDNKPNNKRKSINKKENNYINDDDKKVESNLRVGGRRKRAKKVFDPSDTHIPKKRGRPAGSLNKSTIEKQMAKLSDGDSRPESRSSNGGSGSIILKDQFGVCSVCHATNKKGLPSDNRLVACRECSNKAHFSCLNGEDMMLKLHPDNTWLCPYCKTCVICYETSNAGVLIVCAVCADAYHASCHQPCIPDKFKSNLKWLCMNCEMPEELKINEIQPNMSLSQKSNNSNDGISLSPSVSGNTTPYQSPVQSPTPPPQLSPQSCQIDQNADSNRINMDMSDSQSNKDSDEDSNIDPSIPDASNWTPDEVYEYFKQYFPKEAIIFKEQEIDGRSLLLLRRIDVLTNLKLKLGPALKIYRHVVKLQVRRDDPKLYWL